MPFGASAPSKKYQSDKPTKLRKRGDNGDPNGCNNCHVMCASNDFICSPKLQLSSF